MEILHICDIPNSILNKSHINEREVYEYTSKKTLDHLATIMHLSVQLMMVVSPPALLQVKHLLVKVWHLVIRKHHHCLSLFPLKVSLCTVSTNMSCAIYLLVYSCLKWTCQLVLDSGQGVSPPTKTQLVVSSGQWAGWSCQVHNNTY